MMPLSFWVRMSRPDALAEFQDRLGQRVIAERIAARLRSDGFALGLGEGMVRHGEGQAGEDDVAQRLARHVDALPERVGAEEDRVAVLLELLQQPVARHGAALHEQVIRSLRKKGPSRSACFCIVW